MEEIKAYIETGILELYVLGDLSHNEKIQVEEMAVRHPEIKAEIVEIEMALEAYALNNAIEPPVHLRAKVLNSLLTSFSDDSKFPSHEFLQNDEDDEQDISHNNIVALPQARANSFYKYAFAASMAALIASLIALFSLNNRLNESSQQIALLQQGNQVFANRVNLLDKEVGVFHDPSMKIINLPGTKSTPSSNMKVAWSPVSKKVMIDVKTIKLAANDEAHQYQLWAIVDGKPVDLGVFDAKAEASDGMEEMKPVDNAVAFAVTLEKRGGSLSPTMDQMKVMGGVPSNNTL